MKNILLTSILTISALSMASLNAQILLDEVMTKEEQKNTGVSTLSRRQKLALETWLNKNFIEKTTSEKTEKTLYLSLNINNGQKLQLSDNSIWEIDPNDANTASVWITPFPIKIVPSGDSSYPYLLVDVNSGASVKARKASTPQPQNQQSKTPPTTQ